MVVTIDDLGGVPGLQRTLRDFYVEVLRSIPSWTVRRNVQRLCSDYLISPAGHRLSVDRERDRADADTGRRHPAASGRSSPPARLTIGTDRWYFELGHDSLVQPILATNRVRGTMVGLAGLVRRRAFVCWLCLALSVDPRWTFSALQAHGLNQGLSLIRRCRSLGLTLLLATFGSRQSIETLNRYFPVAHAARR